MNKQDWKSKREISTDIRKVIDDYEAKLCEMHTKNMNLQYDLDRFKTENEKLNKALVEEKKIFSILV